MKTILEKYKGTFLILLSVLFATTGGLTLRYISNYHFTSVYDIAFWSLAGALVITSLYIGASAKHTKKIQKNLYNNYKILSILTLISTINAGTWFYTITIIPIDTISLFEQLGIIWSIALGVLFLHERIRHIQILAILVSIIGLLLVKQSDESIPVYMIPILVFNPLLSAFQSLIYKKYQEELDPLSTTVIRGIGMTLIFGTIFGSLGLLTIPSAIVIIMLSLSQLSGVIFNKICYIEAHKYFPISTLNFFFILLPILTFLISPLIEIEYIFSWLKIIGATLVIIGTYLFVRYTKT